MTDHRAGKRGRAWWVILLWTSAACAGTPGAQAPRTEREAVRPGITVLMEGSLELVEGRRIALISNQTGVDARGISDVELLQRDPREIGRASCRERV